MAYEMRISDWSSDVCSSDLNIAELGVHLGDAAPRRELRHLCDERFVLHRLQRVLVLELRGEQLQEIALVEIGLFRRRSEERRVGQGCVRPGSSRWSQDHSNKQKHIELHNLHEITKIL